MRLGFFVAFLSLVTSACGGAVEEQPVADAQGDAAAEPSDSGSDTFVADATDASDRADAADTSDTTDGAVTPLTIVSTDPSDGAHGVTLDRHIEITFSRPIAPKTGDFSVKAGSQPIEVAFGLSADKRTLDIRPTMRLPILAEITVTVTAGLSAEDGGHLDHDAVTSFETVDGTWGAPVELAADGIFLNVVADVRGGFGYASTSGSGIEVAGAGWSGPWPLWFGGELNVDSALAVNQSGLYELITARGLEKSTTTYNTGVYIDPTTEGDPVVAAEPGGDAVWRAWQNGKTIQIARDDALIDEIAYVKNTGSFNPIALDVGRSYVAFAWADAQTTTTSVVHAFRGKMGTFLTREGEGVLDTTDAWLWNTPKVAIAGDGAMYTTWIGSKSMTIARFDGAWTKRTVSSVAAIGSTSTCAADNGDGLVVWRAVDGVKALRYDASAKAWDAEAVLAAAEPATTVGYGRECAMDAFGNALLTWFDAAGVWAARYDALAKAWRVPVLVGPGGSESRVAIGPYSAVVMWEHPKITAVKLQ